ncbi:asparagine synthase-related protein [Kribbella qitaiheensis]|uniref:asparagine synthase-related protein n=1 Tax=Kribbella qitaiheensis TaxID=1544730 RepID=UPI0036207206
MYIYNTPWSLKTFAGTEKCLLCAATRDVLPESVAERKKSPYPQAGHPGRIAARSPSMPDGVPGLPIRGGGRWSGSSRKRCNCWSACTGSCDTSAATARPPPCTRPSSSRCC